MMCADLGDTVITGRQSKENMTFRPFYGSSAIKRASQTEFHDAFCILHLASCCDVGLGWAVLWFWVMADIADEMTRYVDSYCPDYEYGS